MSITVRDALSLPSLRNARLVAGEGALSRPVSSISVLEYPEPTKLQSDFFTALEFEGSELVISGFINIKDDVEAQMATIRRLSEVGEVGLILFYVGIFVPEISKDAKDLADSLSFAIIEMPPGRMDLRYSDVIADVMEAIFLSRGRKSYYVTEIIEELSLLPESLRSLTTVLRMLRDRLRASLVLSSLSGECEGIAAWPKGREDEVRELFEKGSFPQSVWKCELIVKRRKGRTLKLTIVSEDGQALDDDMTGQALEAINLFLSLWDRGDDEAVISELVRAILSDEPVRMRKLASIFDIDVRSIDSMWIVRRMDGQTLSEQDYSVFRNALPTTILRPVTDLYEGRIVLFLSSRGRFIEMKSLSNYMARAMDGYILSTFYNLADTAAVRNAFLSEERHLEATRAIFPTKRVFGSSDIRFASIVEEEAAKGEDVLSGHLAELAPIVEGDEGRKIEAARTLAVYLLDAGASVQRTAEILSVHTNTIKYRMKRIEELLASSYSEFPSSALLALDVALLRLCFS